MTLKELHGEVCALGFDDFLELDTRFLAAASCALQGIYNAVSVSGKTKFFVKSSLPSSKISVFHHKGGGVDTLPLKGKAYSMRLYGKGVFTVEGENLANRKGFDCEGDVFCGFINGEATVKFIGDLSYTVCDLVTFDELFSDNAADIPDGSGYTTVDLARLLPDFLAFDSIPRDNDGNIIECATLHDGKITFDPEFVGEVEIGYRKMPILPSLDAPDVKIDLPSEYSLLLPLLTASYLLLDDDADKAVHYKEIYESELERVNALKRSISADGYLIADGWA